MRLKSTISFTAFLVLAVLVSPTRADQYGDITVNVESTSDSHRTHGYTEYRVSIANLSAGARHQVTLTTPAQSYYGGTVTRTVTVEPSSTVKVSLFTSIAIAGSGLGVSIDGQQQRDSVALDLASSGYDVRFTVLVSQGASAKAFQNRAGSVLLNPAGKENFYSAKSSVPAAEWSTSWLGYSSYDGVVLTADELRTMPEPAVSALIRYVECGGSLMIIGAWNVPKTWRVEKEEDGILSTYYAGFGVCMVSDNAAVDGLSKSQLLSIGQAWTESQNPWSLSRSGGFDFSTANKTFPVTENVSIPVRGLLLIMLVFVILIGPVNLVILSKKKRKMWLWWTVPAISLITCLAVSAYSLFSEGWSGRARYLSFTILDERSHRASTIGINAFYTPLTPGDGLRYDTETEVTSQAGSPGYSGYSDENSRFRTADWTEDQHLETGWVTARAPAHFMIRRSETRRERLTMTRGTDGSLSVVNGLGVPIRKLWLADEKGTIHYGAAIAAGSSAPLEMSKERLAAGKMGRLLRSVLDDDWINAVQRGANSADLARPGTYIAELEGSPFLEEGLKGIKQKKHEALVYGIMKGPGDEN